MSTSPQNLETPRERVADQESQAARSEIADALRAVVTGEIDLSNRRRGEYSTDASNYRVVPELVVFPRTVEDVVGVVHIAMERGVPLTSRGGGTSVAGNAIGPGIIIDFSRHLNRIHAINGERKTAWLDPGVVLSSLQREAARHGLRFGPDPSTQNRATLGGMIGNNACGPHAVAYGRTADNVAELDVIDGRGRRFIAASGDPRFMVVPGLAELVRANLALIRTEFGQFSRQVSGYSLEHLLPENGSHLARALVGTEGTCVTVLGASVNLVDRPTSPTLVVLGYPDMASAADDVPALLQCQPLAIEGLDARLVEVVRRARGTEAIPALPPGGGWLMIEVSGASDAAARQHAEQVVAAASTRHSVILPPGGEATRMWQIRADGAGLAGRTPAGNQAWPGWEDSAVPPERLGGYLRELDQLMARYGVDGLPYGHFGDGCVHLRLDWPLAAGATEFRSFLQDAAALVAAHGGSMSGEHGDGRARSELLPHMYSAEALGLLQQFKELFDPQNVLNPGVVVNPRPLDADLRRPEAAPTPALSSARKSGGFSFAHDSGDFTTAVHRCVGVGKCRVEHTGTSSFMCPSFQASRDEKDVTRGRARVLQEAINGRLIGGLSSPEVRESLDLCLSCKACSSECPAGVDMAQYKSEVLYRTYRQRLRPRDHYALGWLPRWARLASFWPQAVNAILGWRPIGKLVLRLGGLDPRRSIPPFARQSFRTWYRRASVSPDVRNAGGPRVVLWTDTFSDTMAPQGPQAALKVLTHAGYDVIVPDQQACCGLTWISTGQLDGARRQLHHLLEILGPPAVNGIPIVGLEPSCTAVLRSDLLDLFPDDPRAQAIARQTVTLAELLTNPETAPSSSSQWQLPDLSDITAVVQPHCHHHAVMGFDTDARLLKAAGAQITVLSGCCGMAGNFGMQQGHYETSLAVANLALVPALREAPAQTIFLADGYSCRTQADDLLDVSGVTLAQLLAERIS